MEPAAVGLKKDKDRTVMAVSLPRELIRRVALEASAIDPEYSSKAVVVEAALNDYFASDRAVTKRGRNRRLATSA
jgi:hypothetical protein